MKFWYHFAWSVWAIVLYANFSWMFGSKLFYIQLGPLSFGVTFYECYKKK